MKFKKIDYYKFPEGSVRIYTFEFEDKHFWRLNIYYKNISLLEMIYNDQYEVVQDFNLITNSISSDIEKSIEKVANKFKEKKEETK